MMPENTRAITTYRELQAVQRSPARKVRDLARELALFPLGHLRAIPRHGRWIRFPYYHHVFSDEREGFDAQLRYMKNFGDFISIDDAVAALHHERPLEGRYYCITFDDGFRSCWEHAVPVLLEHGATAAFFLPTQFIGTSLEHDREVIRSFHRGGRLIEFLSWDECREMLDAGMTIGAHTVHHRPLIELTDAEVEWELSESKKVIEDRLGIHCRHFAAPFGVPGVDFHQRRDPEIARRLGYASFLTTRRGSLHRLPAPMQIERDHMIAAAPIWHLRYFLGR